MKLNWQKYSANCEPKLMAIHHHWSGFCVRSIEMDARNLFIFALLRFPTPTTLSLSPSISLSLCVRDAVVISLSIRWQQQYCLNFVCSKCWQKYVFTYKSMAHWFPSSLTMLLAFYKYFHSTETRQIAMLLGWYRVKMFAARSTMKSKSIKFFADGFSSMRAYFSLGRPIFSHIFSGLQAVCSSNQHQTYKTIKPSILAWILVSHLLLCVQYRTASPRMPFSSRNLA